MDHDVAPAASWHSSRASCSRAFCLLIALCLSGATARELSAQSATFAGLETTVASGLNFPSGMAVDKDGNVFISDTENYRILKIPAAGGPAVTVVSFDSSDDPRALAIDGLGNIYVVVDIYSSLIKLSPTSTGKYSGTGVKATFSEASALAVDSTGDLFIADEAYGKVYELPAGGGPQITLNTPGLKGPISLAVDAQNDLFIGDNFANDIIEEPANGGAQITVASNLQPLGMALDALGDLFIASDPQSTGTPQTVSEILAGTSTVTAVPITGLTSPYAIAVNGLGNLFVSDTTLNEVIEFQTKTANFGAANVCTAGNTTPTPCNQSLTLTVSQRYRPVAPQVSFQTRVVTEGSYNQDFVLSNQTCGKEVNLLTTCTDTITFAPGVAGPRKGSLQIIAYPVNLVVLDLPLYGVGNAPQIAYNSGAQSTIAATGLNNPSAIATDTVGDVFIVDSGNNRVVEMPAGGGSQTTVNTGTVTLNNPQGVAVDGAGDLYIADFGNDQVVEVFANGQAATTVVAGVAAAGVAVDTAGDVFVSDYSNNKVIEYPVDGGSGVTLATAADSVREPRGLAVDNAGNLFIASSGNALVIEKPISGLAITAIGSGWTAPYAVALDAAGDVYVADTGAASVVEVPAADGSPTPIGAGLKNPAGVAVDGHGNLFVTNNGTDTAVTIPRTQSPALTFASTSVGATSTDSPQTAFVQNVGNQPLVLSQVTYPADFLQASTSGDTDPCTSTTTVDPGSACGLSVSFTPTKAGALSESLTITDNALNVTGATQSIAVSGTATAAAVPATLTAPAPGSTLTGTSATFAWTTGSGVTQYTIHVGTTGVGSTNISAPGSLTTTSYTVSNIPATGATLYVRLYSFISGAWQYTDYTYTEASSAAKAVMTTPAPGSTLAGSSVKFTWTAGSGVTQYTIHAGTTGVGSTNIGSPSSALTTTSYTFSNIPTSGATLYIRLYSFIAGAWQYTDYTYTEASPAAKAVMSTPAPGSTLKGSSATFTWTPGDQVTQYTIHVGTTGVGSSNIGSPASALTTTTYTVSGIPTTGATLYVRLYSFIGGAWQYTDYTYTEASPSAQAVMTTPAPASTLAGSSVTFSWTPGSQVTQYTLHVGTTGAGSSNISAPGSLSTTSYTVNGIPTTGGPLYVRLYSFIAGAWQYTDYTYTEQ